MIPGTIIFLNGSSSAGKTTLAHALQDKLTSPYQHVALDQFRDGLPDKFRGLNAPVGTDGSRGLNVVPADAHTIKIVFGETGITLLKGMRRGIAAMANAGNNIIVDDIILHKDFLEDYLQVFAHLQVYFVGVHCALSVVNEREAKRPGRFPGTAAGHLERCHAHNIYDIEVDTGEQSVDDCSSKVISRLQREPCAFDQLLQKL
jgi:chloramphenicol 3-O phosphotransferase